MQQAQTLARDRKTEASARAYFDAADLFASAAAGAAAGGGAARAEEDATVPEAAPSPSPSLLPRLRRRNPIRRPPVPKPSGRCRSGYRRVCVRRCRAAIAGRCWRYTRTAPAEMLAALGKRPRGYNMRIIDNRFMASDSRGRPEVALSVVHESLTPSGAAEEQTQQRIVTRTRRTTSKVAPDGSCEQSADRVPRIPIRRPACRGLRSGRAGQRRPLSFLLVAVSRDPDQGSARHPAR